MLDTIPEINLKRRKRCKSVVAAKLMKLDSTDLRMAILEVLAEFGFGADEIKELKQARPCNGHRRALCAGDYLAKTLGFSVH